MGPRSSSAYHMRGVHKVAFSVHTLFSYVLGHLSEYVCVFVQPKTATHDTPTFTLVLFHVTLAAGDDFGVPSRILL